MRQKQIPGNLNAGSDTGTFLQEYFVYFKKVTRSGYNFSEEAADVLRGAA